MSSGTALGDPIELGAASTVFDTTPHGSPVTLMASKGFLGHTEPAAGLVSLIMAASSLQNLAAFPIMHLKTLNPHVAAIMAGSPGSVTLPRQCSALAQAHALPSTGISSFAFQGTNAHAVLQASATAGQDSLAVADVLWQQQRQWVLPLAHCLIRQHLPGALPSQATFACSIQQPALAFLWEHEVMDRSLFPGAGYFEMALAALRTLHTGSSLHTAENCLTQIAIPAPLVLPPSIATSVTMLTCLVNLSSQAVSVVSLDGHVFETVHMRGHFTQAQLSSQAGSATASASGALMVLLKADQSLKQLSLLKPFQPAAQAFIAPAVAATQQDSGFWHHPARSDSFLQMGQLFLESPAGSIHVPAGVACLSLPRKMDTAQSMHGHCQPSGVALSSDYTLADQQASSCCQIQGMQAKAITARPSPNTAEATAQAAEQHESSTQVLYEMAWLADHQSLPVPSAANCSSIQLAVSRQTPAVACAHALAALQDCMAKRPQSHLTLQGSSGMTQNDGSCMQALAGACRTAAVEAKVSISVLESSPLQGDVCIQYNITPVKFMR